MRGFIDLHCHYLPAVDDGVRTVDEGRALLRALHEVGFDRVVATPHIRPAMFDNSPARLRQLFAELAPELEEQGPAIELAAEHFFDDVVYDLLLRKQALPYGAGRAALVEFAYERLPVALSSRFFDLRCKLVRPVVAHPERYEPFFRDPVRTAESMRRAGAVLLLDVAALLGKYGSKAQRAAETLLEERAYYAACSDAHRPADAEVVGQSIARLERLVGADETARLFRTGPREILEGRIFDAYD